MAGSYYDARPEERISLAFYNPERASEKLVEEVQKALERPGTKAAALAAIRGQNYSEVEKRYHTISQPTLLLWGREDVVTPVRYGERLVSDLPNAELVVYPRCGHFPMLEAVSPSNRRLVAFLHDELAFSAAESAPPAASPGETPAQPSEVSP